MPVTITRRHTGKVDIIRVQSKNIGKSTIPKLVNTLFSILGNPAVPRTSPIIVPIQATTNVLTTSEALNFDEVIPIDLYIASVRLSFLTLILPTLLAIPKIARIKNNPIISIGIKSIFFACEKVS